MSPAVGHHTSSFFAPILKIPVVPRHQVITSRVDRAPLLKALSRTLKNISTYRRASPSFSRRFSHARHREDIFRAASGKIFADFRSGCCIADKVFPRRMLHAADPAYRQPGWVTSDLCRSGRGGNSVEFHGRIGTSLWLHARTDMCFHDVSAICISSSGSQLDPNYHLRFIVVWRGS